MFDAVIIFILLLGLYLLPAWVAVNRNHHNTGAIFVLNLFLGWTLIGWVAALVWASTQTNRIHVTRESNSIN